MPDPSTLRFTECRYDDFAGETARESSREKLFELVHIPNMLTIINPHALSLIVMFYRDRIGPSTLEAIYVIMGDKTDRDALTSDLSHIVAQTAS